MKKILYFIFFATIIFMSACSEVVTVDIPQSADKLVVEGYVSTETDSSYIMLSKTVSYYSLAKIPQVNDAFVKVNADTFFNVGFGYYKPRSPYKGITNVTYNLAVAYQGVTYKSVSTLQPLIKIDTLFKIIHHDKELIAPDGYSLSFNFMFDNENQYTYFRDGFKNDLTSFGKDSIYDQLVTFDSKNSFYGVWMPFDVPLLRLQPNDTALLLFKSCDFNAFNYYNAISANARGGSPFSSPPSNLPTNITGGALGFFAAQDVKHYRIRIKP